MRFVDKCLASIFVLLELVFLFSLLLFLDVCCGLSVSLRLMSGAMTMHL